MVPVNWSCPDYSKLREVFQFVSQVYPMTFSRIWGEKQSVARKKGKDGTGGRT